MIEWTKRASDRLLSAVLRETEAAAVICWDASCGYCVTVSNPHGHKLVMKTCCKYTSGQTTCGSCHTTSVNCPK